MNVLKLSGDKNQVTKYGLFCDCATNFDSMQVLCGLPDLLESGIF